MSDNSAEVRITGDSSSAVDAMHKASTAVTNGVGSMKGALGQMAEVFGSVQGYFAGLVAIVGGGKFFKEAINESNKLTGEVMKLSKTLGITGDEANALNTALGDIYSDSDTYIGAYQRFAGQLRRNEQGLQEMGLATRDANGHLRDGNTVFMEAIKMTTDYAPGLDQTTASQKLFGKSIDDVMKLQKLNNTLLDEAREKNEALGLTVTQENVEASKKYKAAMNDVGDVMTAVMKTIGDAVMPAFTELAEYLASTGPYVVAVFKGALTGLMLVFRALQAVVKTVAAVIFEMINGVIDQVGNLSELISAVLSGDWDRAARAAEAFRDRSVQAFKNVKDAAADAFSDAGGKFSEDLDRTWNKGSSAKGGAGKGTRQMGDLKENKGDESRMGGWEAALAEKKIAYQKENDLREMSKEDEVNYWKEILNRTDLSLKEKDALRRKSAEAELALLREQRIREDELTLEGIEAYKNTQLKVLDYQKQEAETKVALQQMTQLEMIQLEAKLEDERNRITAEAIQSRLKLLEKDPTKNAVALKKLNDELLAEEQEHMLKSRGLQLTAQKEQMKDWQGLFNNIGSAFGNTVGGLLTHTMTMSKAVKSLMQSVAQSVGNFISQIIQKKVAAWATEKALTLAGIGADAAKAGSGAAASQASIPYVGPILAVAAMAAIFAGVMGMTSKVPTASAAGGFDIPSGLNPVVQTHAREMILPAHLADVIRGMASNGGPDGSSGGDTHHWYVNAVDAKGMEDMLIKRGGGDALVKSLVERKRNSGFGRV